jgi:hypothetical protein
MPLLPVIGNLTTLTVAAPALPPELTAELAPSDHPLLLLPVRLETRFFALADGTQELRVRIYPDQIHVDSFEPELGGRTLFASISGSRSGACDMTAAERVAWQQLADRSMRVAPFDRTLLESDERRGLAHGPDCA